MLDGGDIVATLRDDHVYADNISEGPALVPPAIFPLHDSLEKRVRERRAGGRVTNNVIYHII